METGIQGLAVAFEACSHLRASLMQGLVGMQQLLQNIKSHRVTFQTLLRSKWERDRRSGSETIPLYISPVE